MPKNSDYAFPFVKAAVQMIKYLCSMLEIGSSDNDEEVVTNGLRESVRTRSSVKKQFEIMFIMFTVNNDGAFEFFGKCLWLFHRLWVEMKAQSLDFDRVKITALYTYNVNSCH